MHKIRLLFLGGGPSMPSTQPLEMKKYECFSEYFSGDIITPVMNPRHKVIKTIGNFNYYPFVVSRKIMMKNIKLIWVYISKTLNNYRKNGKYDIIIVSNPLLAGFIALLLGKIIQAKVIIEVNGNFELAFKYGRKGEVKPSFIELLKERYSKITIPLILKKASMIKLLSDNQLIPFHLSYEEIRANVFSDFVPVDEFIKAARDDKKYILLVGYPWYLKGVDILIKAFNAITSNFPEYKLKIVGWCPEGRDYYEKLANNNPRIELCDPVRYHEIIPLFANCSLYVLASRTEAMGRVLIEAMACQKPVIASNVGGVYSIVKDGYNGLMFEKENIYDLAEKMRYLLSHPEEAERLAKNGRQYVMEHLSEAHYINNYRNMIFTTLDIEI